MGLIAAMLSIPFNDPDFTAPDLPVATLTYQQSWHSDITRCVAALPPLPDGPTNSVLGSNSRFVTGNDDDTVKVWVEQGGVWSVEATLTDPGGSVLCVAVLADGRFVTGSRDQTVKVCKESSPGSGVWSVEATLTGHRNWVNCVAVLADGRLVTGSWDSTVKVWKESSPGSGVWSVEATLGGLTHLTVGVFCVAVLADGRLTTGSGDNTVKVWKESSTGSGVWSVEATLTGHGGVVSCVAVLPPLPDAPTKVRCVTGSEDNTVKVWVEQGSTWSVEATLGGRSGHSDDVNCVAVLPDASTGEPRLVTASSDYTVKVWVEQGGQWSVEATLGGLTHQRSHQACVAVLPPLPFGSSLGPVESYGVEDADGRLVTGSTDNTVRVWG